MSSSSEPVVDSLLQALVFGGIGVFTGVALYVSVVEHPARLRIAKSDTPAALRQWNEGFGTAAKIQGSLAVATAAASGFLAVKSGVLYPYGFTGLLMGGIASFTLVVISPVITRLYAAVEKKTDVTDEAVRDLLTRWGRLHSVRTVVSVTSLAILLYSKFF